MKVQHDRHSLAYPMKMVDDKKKFGNIIHAIENTIEDLKSIANHIELNLAIFPNQTKFYTCSTVYIDADIFTQKLKSIILYA